MPGDKENYDGYVESRSESMVEEIEAAIRLTTTDLNDLQSEIFGGTKKVDIKSFDSINKFYTVEGDKITFWINQVRNYLDAVHGRLSGMKVQKFSEISKENNFTGTILAIQIALKAMRTNPKNPKEYNVGKINGEYNETTKNAIQKFQTDCKLTYKDGKPGKETIGRLIKELDNFLNNKKIEREESEKLRNDVKKIIKDSFKMNANAGLLYYQGTVDSMVNYIVEGKLGSGENKDLEKDISTLSKGPFNGKLQYLINHPKMPLAQALKGAENEQNEKDAEMRKLVNNPGMDKRETIKEGGFKISDAMFQQLLHIEGSQGYVSKVHKKNLGENFPTGPYGMVYKHIDAKGNLLKDIVPFKEGESVSKEWALKNARAFYNKRAKEWGDSLSNKGYQYTQDMLDALVSASGGTIKSYNRLKDYVITNWSNKTNIYNYMLQFATRGRGGKKLRGLVKRRKFEANWFKGNKQPYDSYKA